MSVWVHVGAGVLAMGLAVAHADTSRTQKVELSCGTTATLTARYDAAGQVRALRLATSTADAKTYRGDALRALIRDHATVLAQATERHYLRVRGNTKSGKGRLLHGKQLAALKARVAALKVRATALHGDEPATRNTDELLPRIGISKSSLELHVCTHRAWCYVDADPRGRACSPIYRERVVHADDIADVCRQRYGRNAFAVASGNQKKWNAQCIIDIRAVTHDACKIRLAIDTPNVHNAPKALLLAEKLSQLSTACAGPTGRPLWVTSGCRDPRHQATLMFDAFSRRSAGKENVYSRREPAKRKNKRYELAGELVTVYRTSARHRRKGGIDRDTAIDRMTRIIRRQMKRGDYVSEHLRASAVDIRTFCYGPAQADALAACIRRQPNVTLVDERRKKWKPHFHLNFRLQKRIRCQ